VAHGQYEVSLHYDNPLLIADAIMLTKHLIKQVAYNHGLLATFMPKPFATMNGTGMHIHISIADTNSHTNLFFDENNPAFLSTTALQCIAGILNRIHDGTILLNSTVNSFKRLVPGYEAPVYICWGAKNRSALIRIPLIDVSEPYAARIEIRSADALCNPYLAFNFLVQAGFAGILYQEPVINSIEENLFKLTMQEIKQRNIQTLPTSLHQALSCFASSLCMPTLFPQVFIQEFVKLKSEEVFQFHKAVTNWEKERYL
jgi:glutamine synthetase